MMLQLDFEFEVNCWKVISYFSTTKPCFLINVHYSELPSHRISLALKYLKFLCGDSGLLSRRYIWCLIFVYLLQQKSLGRMDSLLAHIHLSHSFGHPQPQTGSDAQGRWATFPGWWERGLACPASCRDRTAVLELFAHMAGTQDWTALSRHQNNSWYRQLLTPFLRCLGIFPDLPS